MKPFLLTGLLWICLYHSASSQSTGKYISDSRKGCKVWTDYYTPSLSVSWDGACKDLYAEGPGTLIWLNEGKEVARYAGQMQKGYPNGKGKYVWSNGYLQEGNYFQGAFLNLDSAYQNRIEKITLAMTDSSNLYINDGASQSLFYYTLSPVGKIKGALILLAGSSETANNVLTNNVKLVQLASNSGLLVVVPSINNNLVLGKNELVFLNAAFKDVLTRYKISKDSIIIGGFSLGGLYALRYTEMANEKAYSTVIRPRAVFAADPPVDLARLYDVFQREIDRNISVNAVLECKRYIGNMEKDLGGDPYGSPEKYILYSVFSRSRKDGGNIRYLQTTPVRIYSDPDIDWQMKERKGDYFDMGAIDQTTMINKLKTFGNARAEFINALGKGHNPDGGRNPHSWSIIDASECMVWIMKCLGE